jgi:prolipoprotein diacylglyceryl transferase
MTSLFITWNPSPEMFNIGGFAVRWYGLLFAAGFFFGYLIMQKIFKKEQIPAKVLDRLTIYMLLGTVIGARLGHCLFYEPGYYFAHPWEILNIRQGGLASHGAAIGILGALGFFSYFQKKSYSWIVDRIVIVVALSGFFIRSGNLLNSEIVGSPTNVSWAFIFPQVDLIPRHPAQIYELLAYLAIFFLLWWLFFKKNAGEKPFLLTGLFMVLVFGFRFFVEFIKDIQVDSEKTMTLNLGQRLSIPIIVVGIILIAFSLRKAKS